MRVFRTSRARKRSSQSIVSKRNSAESDPRYLADVREKLLLVLDEVEAMTLVGAKGALLDEAVGHAADLAKLLGDGLTAGSEISDAELEDLRILRQRIDVLRRG